MSGFEDVVGQEKAVAALTAAAASPVHAYLLVGPPGSGKRPAARAFAAALLCHDGGCGQCATCRRVASETHPDLVVVERQGPSITIDQAREIRRLALRSPTESRRKVLLLTDFHLAREAGPALLKVVEEPPPSTVFVILADHVPPELATIASRCIRIDFRALPAGVVAEVLAAGGLDPLTAAEVAEAAGGRLDRARLLAADPGFRSRRDAWREVPGRLDGTGVTVATVVAELVDALDRAAGPLEARQAAERAALEERLAGAGDRGSGRKEMTDRHRREVRRLRTDELRLGLATLSGAYRDALLDGGGAAAACTSAVDTLQAAAEALVRNPSETLFLQALLLSLPPLEPTAA